MTRQMHEETAKWQDLVVFYTVYQELISWKGPEREILRGWDVAWRRLRFSRKHPVTQGSRTRKRLSGRIG